jgi:hypothetical protein
MLPNGSILVIGGETGSNANPQPNLEIVPKPAGGDTVVPLDWLARTDPFNLYPFVIVLPSTHLFVGKVETVLAWLHLITSFFKVITTKPEFSTQSHLIPSHSYPIFPARSMTVRIFGLLNYCLIHCLCSPCWSHISTGR